MKKVCLIYANCQNQPIAQYLNRSAEFNREYLIHRFPVHNLIEKQTTIPSELLQKVDLFIYQPVKEIHGERSSQAVLAKLSSRCKKISFPSLYFKGYFPQFCKNLHNQVIKPNYPFGVIPHGDSNIISLVNEGKTSQEIVDILSQPNYYSREAVINNLNNTISELAKRESNLDVEASNFIQENYQKYHLFYTQNHPADLVCHHIVNQILALLDLPKIDFPPSANNPLRGILGDLQIPIYPSVIKHLGLQFISCDSVYRYSSFASNQMTFARYIEEYIDVHFPTKENANQVYFAAISLDKQGKDRAAIEKLESAIKIKPNNASYYLSLGDLYTKIDRCDRAIICYQKSIELSPTWENSYQALGKLLEKQKKFKQAILVYQKYLQIDSGSASIYRNLGDILLQQNQLALAAKIYQKAIDLDPVNAFNYCRLGNVYKKQKTWNLAASNYQKAIDLSRQTPYLYANFSDVLIEQNHLDRAIEICLQGIKIKPQKKRISARLYRNLGDAYLQQNKLDLAADTYQKAIQVTPKNAFHYRCLGDVRRKQKSWQLAISNYQKAIALSPKTPYLYINLSDIFLKQNKPQEAIKICQQGIDLNPQENQKIFVKLNNILQGQNKSYARI